MTLPALLTQPVNQQYLATCCLHVTPKWVRHEFPVEKPIVPTGDQLTCHRPEKQWRPKLHRNRLLLNWVHVFSKPGVQRRSQYRHSRDVLVDVTRPDQSVVQTVATVITEKAERRNSFLDDDAHRPWGRG
ncbi:uncharacterized protein LOC126475019 isoform X2 [Schistocerca serialis cubense]|uniref:uncharacterized protein LOC126475019 isoform X2 n=1 Tax=Schistocerca serialis cubense TaxID=2023355 RepID=UPI00214ECE04|nr:uncharacterized protein LOC126475019 isoform X2 [Schistocerca serialis cubense]